MNLSNGDFKSVQFTLNLKNPWGNPGIFGILCPRMSERRIGKYGRGIPRSEFREDRHDKKFHEVYGSDLRAKINNRSIDIRDDSGRRFTATVGKNRTVEFKVKTVNRNGKHPDLFAQRLILWALKFFRDRGTRIRALCATWEPDVLHHRSTNHEAYVEERRSGRSKRDAARKTWTGRAVRKFFDIQSEDHVFESGRVLEGADITALFHPKKRT